MLILISHGATGGPTTGRTLSGVTGGGEECIKERFRLHPKLDLFETYSGFLLATAR